jgi:hypothetical protein
VTSPPSDRKVVLVNLTGHPLTLMNELGGRVELPVEGKARVRAKMQPAFRGELARSGLVIPVLDIEEQEIVGLPHRIAGVLYVVSGVVGSLAGKLGRRDVVSPGRVRKDRHGRVIGAQALVRVKVADDV